AAMLRACKTRYVVMRAKPWFPECKRGGDIDILCEDPRQMACELVAAVPSGYSARCRSENGHQHVDLYGERGFELRFDCVESIGPEGYVERVLSRRIMYFDGVWFPCRADDIALRLIEFKANPHKTWHIDYVIGELIREANEDRRTDLRAEAVPDNAVPTGR